MLGKVLEDLTLVKRSKYFLIATLTLLNPVFFRSSSRPL
jgi:hypothetical protein